MNGFTGFLSSFDRVLVSGQTMLITTNYNLDHASSESTWIPRHGHNQRYNRYRTIDTPTQEVSTDPVAHVHRPRYAVKSRGPCKEQERTANEHWGPLKNKVN